MTRPSLGRLGIRALAIAVLASGIGAGLYLDQPDRPVTAVFGSELTAAEVELAKQGVRDSAVEREKLAEAARAQAAAAAALAAARVKAANDEASRRGAARNTGGSTTPTKPPVYGPIPASCNAYKGARATGCALLLKAGFGLDQMPCLDKLWKRESGWNYKAYNEGSGAFGIPQALPGDKMKSAGADWKTNPATQIKWGLGYIKGRYKTPCKAWQHSEDVGWY
ncbi:hypothetical protein F4553_005022 [Allocatelliglobosispora scoriae]|uniref:Lytic transglycosylase domain-containing protein n=1 Tax=Allocatelliglobosispora scoriae TaxID=643052 RepID=A0A841BXI6_9ACTN|nr:lytic transglycosylase domain-containing protein [Allocatelliglobosispora scoriae]MBB5871643.1 hypothetical protein [Allocatelliglobosispora scoriae]